MRSDGQFLARVPALPGGLSEGPRAQSFLDHLSAGAPQQVGTMGFFTSVDGRERRVSYRQVPGYPLYVLSGYERSSIMSQLKAQMMAHLVFGIPATLALFWLSALALVYARRAEREQAAHARAQAELADAKRLEGLGRLTGGVAHDFNNLLTVIQGGLSLIRRRAADERVLRQVGMMETAVQRGATLTGQLLAFGRRQALKSVPVDVEACLKRVRRMGLATARADIGIELEIAPALWPVQADPAALDQILLNLLVNALDAMPEGGVATLRARNAAGEQVRRQGLDGGFVAISVRDTGAGMTPEVQERIFEPFFTTKPMGRGTGLGLSQVHGIVEQSGGKIEVRSRPGIGSEFTIYLPRARGKPDATPEPASATDEGQLAGKSILLVEDNEEVASTTAALLDDLGMKVVRVADGQSALRELDTGAQYDVVLSDIVMPGPVSGIEVAARWRSARPGARVILMTGYAEPLARAENSAVPVMAKPFDIKRFEALAMAEVAGPAAA